MRLHYSAAARLQIERLPSYLQIRVLRKLAHYAAQPDPLEFAEPLVGVDLYRFRVGDYRVIFEVLHDAIWVLAVRRRDEAYR